MRLKFTFTIEKNKFKEVDTATQRCLRDLVRQATDDVVEIARALAPIDTGELRSSIRGEISGNQYYTEGEITVGAEYGMYQEFGTKYFAAQPFLGPAVEAVSDDWDRRVQDALESAFEEGCQG